MSKFKIVDCQGKVIGIFPSKNMAEKEKKILKELQGMWGLRILEVKEEGYGTRKRSG